MAYGRRVYVMRSGRVIRKGDIMLDQSIQPVNPLSACICDGKVYVIGSDLKIYRSDSVYSGLSPYCSIIPKSLSLDVGDLFGYLPSILITKDSLYYLDLNVGYSPTHIYGDIYSLSLVEMSDYSVDTIKKVVKSVLVDTTIDITNHGFYSILDKGSDNWYIWQSAVCERNRDSMSGLEVEFTAISGYPFKLLFLWDEYGSETNAYINNKIRQYYTHTGYISGRFVIDVKGGEVPYIFVRAVEGNDISLEVRVYIV